VDALCLVGASTFAFLMDALGVPVAGVGFVDAHELALVAGLLLWSAAPRRCWHRAAAAVHLLFAAANAAHWGSFVSADIALSAFVTTSMHLLFATLEWVAGRAADGVRVLDAPAGAA
jgi:hypothetical protein